MRFSDKLTFVVFTFNEAARVERVVRNLREAGVVLVVDNESSDRTREIAERCGAEVLVHKNPGWVEDEHTVAIVKAHVRTPWIYWGYADEMLDEATLLAILDAVDSGRYQIVSVARKNFYYGAFCHDAYANRLNRVFRKDAIDFTGNTIHRFGKIAIDEREVCHLDDRRYFVRHFISNDAKSYLRSIDGYSDIQAREETGSRGGVRWAIGLVKGAAVNYFARGAYRAGRPGIFLVMQMAYYECLLQMKRFEREAGLTASAIEERNNRERDALLSRMSA